MASHKFEGFTPISSDHMDGVIYNHIDHKMRVRFKNGYTYEVSGVSAKDYQAFMDAPSKGAHWHARVKDKYHVERVR